MSSVILRKFWLENETGDSIPLNGERGVWLIDPTGLGVNHNSSFTDYSYGFFHPIEAEKDPQQTIAGDLYFIDPTDPYMEYKRFVDWVSRSNVIYLVYRPSSIQYRRKIRLSYLTKTELMTQECLKTPIAMYGLTPWFTTVERSIDGAFVTVNNPFIVSEDIHHPSKTPTPVGRSRVISKAEYESFTDEQKASVARLTKDNVARVSALVYSSGHKPSPFKIEYHGILKNPTIRVYGQNTGTQYGRCALRNLVTTVNDTFYYSSDYENSYIMTKNAYGQSSLLNYVENLTWEVYPRIPISEPCMVEVTSGFDISNSINLTIINYYNGV